MSTLKQRTLSGFKWGAVERVLNYGIAFIISIIIARILDPPDYGIIGMVAIFMAVAQVFVEGGFGSAIVRKQSRTDVDFSTVFFYNIFAGFVFYLLLFIGAPFIADFYDMPILVPVTRVVGLNAIIGSFGAMHRSKLIITIDFKTQAKISMISLSIAGTVGIIMAYAGYGVWALVFQGFASSLLSTILLWYFVRWKPLWCFSKESFNELFGYGSKIMLAGLLNTIYNNIYTMIIGKKYNAAELGFFTRADGIAQLPSLNITSIIQRVTFPVLSEIQDENERLALSYRRLLKMAAFITFPLMMLLSALSAPLIRLLLTDKWSPSAPLLSILCVGYMFYPIHSINVNLLQVKGRSDLFLRLEIIKKVMITVVILVSFSFGVKAICIGIVVTSLLALVLNTYYTGKFIHIGYFKQVMDLLPSFLISIIAGLLAFIPSIFLKNDILQLLCGGLAGMGFYFVASYVLKLSELKELIQIIKERNILSGLRI